MMQPSALCSQPEDEDPEDKDTKFRVYLRTFAGTRGECDLDGVDEGDVCHPHCDDEKNPHPRVFPDEVNRQLNMKTGDDLVIYRNHELHHGRWDITRLLHAHSAASIVAKVLSLEEAAARVPTFPLMRVGRLLWRLISLLEKRAIARFPIRK